ncbi:gluconolactonase precursor [Pyrenophora tritici-repentis Pt-1C-BFP]|uniref:Gluconolactonase n=1 Tax=Pyrenophora tritici-repentis (strain Pt-1C-BFP) TaxID=426418 RepID=B2WPQ2_PYRTR|nr:gluconolactonase precursor [Pyrenophora tritici-repentis Pt-1C-BFP]EDU46118.1 gluconolactonase precursor [Pyrenophora tritici-repentis Pt-1C-BFP]
MTELPRVQSDTVFDTSQKPRRTDASKKRLSAIDSITALVCVVSRDILGHETKLDLLLEKTNCPFAHEAGVYVPEDDSLWITSNQYPHPETGKPHIHISRIQLPSSADSAKTEYSEIDVTDVPLPNGGVNYKNGVLFCAQGTLDTPGGIAFMPLAPSTGSTYEAKLLVSSFHGRPFNSPNDVVVHSDGSIWFTDPIYGWEQGIRPRPRLPNQVYRYDPATENVRPIADGLCRPNGICFSPDESTVYITDTDWIHGDGTTDEMRVSHM